MIVNANVSKRKKISWITECDVFFTLSITFFSQVYLEAALLYDAVYLYALALEKSLREGVDPDDGYNISQRLFNMTFMGKIYFLKTPLDP